jgi:5-methylcytosine-specific restriction enzyme A
LIVSIKRERGSVCEKWAATSSGIVGDHVRKMRNGGATLDPRSVMLMCMKFHSLKTAQPKRE